MTVLDRTVWLSAAETAARAGISYRQLDYWTRSRVIVPAGVTDWHDNPAEGLDTATPGTGRARRFTERQAAILAACGRLARLCAGVEVLAALVAACKYVTLPATVAIDVDGRAHLDPADPASIGACWLVTVEEYHPGRWGA